MRYGAYNVYDIQRLDVAISESRNHIYALKCSMNRKMIHQTASLIIYTLPNGFLLAHPNHLQIFLRLSVPPLLVHDPCARNHNLHGNRYEQEAGQTRSMLAHHDAHSLWQTPAQPFRVVLERTVNLLHHILEVLGLEVAQDLHGSALDLLDVADCSSTAVIDGDHAVHQIVVLLVVGAGHMFDHLVNLRYTIVDDLNAVVQVCKLVCLASNAASQDVFEHLRNIGVVGITLFVGLLRMALLRSHVGLFLMPGGFGVLLVGLFASVGVCGGDDELVDFEGVGVLGG
jgi:hypothetical protein